MFISRFKFDYEKAEAKAIGFAEGYTEGVADARKDAIHKKYTPNEIRKILGFPPVKDGVDFHFSAVDEIHAAEDPVENRENTSEAPTEDPVNHPNHYTRGGIECIAALEASMSPIEYVGFLKGQILKYIWRYRLKGKPVEDLKKARYYLDRLIEREEAYPFG